MVRSLMKRMLRTKTMDIDTVSLTDTKLSRCLTTTDMTLLALGSMIESGFDEVSAMLAKDVAGPGVVLAYLLSGVAVYSAALCYAELGARYPKTGSAYCYMYLALGELPAFIVGSCVTLEKIMVNSAVARSCSSFIDALTDDWIREFIDSLIGQVTIPYMSKHVDILAFFIVLFITMLLSFGVRSTSRIHSLFTIINITALITAIGAGAYYSDITNWTSKQTGGFLPYGFSGVIVASVSCLFAYEGFDVIASSAEESKDPKKSIPIATTVSIVITAMVYIGVSSVMTLMVNYQDINEEDGLPQALAVHGASWARIIVMTGSFCSFITSLIGNTFTLTRLIFSMADDGLLFDIFRTVNKKSMLPVTAMCSSGVITGVLAMILNVQTLLELLSVGSLIAHLVVSASVIIIRYRPYDKSTRTTQQANGRDSEGVPRVVPTDNEMTGRLKKRYDCLKCFIDLPPGKMVCACVVTMSILMLFLCVVLWVVQNEAHRMSWGLISAIVVLCLAIAMCYFTITIHQQSSTPLPYKVPSVPLVPSISIFVNSLLIANLQVATWIPLSIWIALGLTVYFGYGISHSKLNTPSERDSGCCCCPGTMTECALKKGSSSSLEINQFENEIIVTHL